MMNAYILLDRSGSMSDKWSEALSSINVYVRGLAKEKATKSAKVTLATFDEQGGIKFDVIRQAVAASKWEDVTNKDAEPRGMTPLYDAIGRLIGLADKETPEKAVIVVMTDGLENASREMTKDAARAALDRARGKNWQVMFLGAEFDAMAQAASVGTAQAQTINSTTKGLAATLATASTYSANYAATGRAMAWSDEDRKRAAAK